MMGESVLESSYSRERMPPKRDNSCNPPTQTLQVREILHLQDLCFQEVSHVNLQKKVVGKDPAEAASPSNPCVGQVTAEPTVESGLPLPIGPPAAKAGVSLGNSHLFSLRRSVYGSFADKEASVWKESFSNLPKVTLFIIRKNKTKNHQS